MDLFYKTLLNVINSSLNFLKKSPANNKLISSVEDYYKAEYNKAVSSLKLINALPGKIPDLKYIKTWQFTIACQQLVRFPNLGTEEIFSNILIDAGINKEDRDRLLSQFKEVKVLNEKSN
jgi:hypothetical protein